MVPYPSHAEAIEPIPFSSASRTSWTGRAAWLPVRPLAILTGAAELCERLRPVDARGVIAVNLSWGTVLSFQARLRVGAAGDRLRAEAAARFRTGARSRRRPRGSTGRPRRPASRTGGPRRRRDGHGALPARPRPLPAHRRGTGPRRPEPRRVGTPLVSPGRARSPRGTAPGPGGGDEEVPRRTPQAPPRAVPPHRVGGSRSPDWRGSRRERGERGCWRPPTVHSNGPRHSKAMRASCNANGREPWWTAP